MLKCDQKHLDQSFAFFLAKDTTHYKKPSQIFHVDGKDIPLGQPIEKFEIISAKPVLTYQDFEYIQLEPDGKMEYVNGHVQKILPEEMGLMLKLTPDGARKLSLSAKANIGKIFLAKTKSSKVVITKNTDGKSGSSLLFRSSNDFKPEESFSALCK